MFTQIQNLLAEIHVLFGKFKKPVTDLAQKALTVSSNLKAALDSGAVKLLEDIIPGKWDKEITDKISAALSKVIPEISIVATCGKADTPLDMVNCWLESIKTLPLAMQDASLQKFSAILLNLLDEGKLKQHDYDLIIQSNYSLHKLG